MNHKNSRHIYFSPRFTRLLVLNLTAILFPVHAYSCPDIDGLADINCDRALVIHAFGDSITRGVADSLGLGYPGRLGQLLPNALITNLGKPGEETSKGRNRAASEFASRRVADYIIILEGVNDYFTSNRSASRTRSNLLSMVSRGQNTGAITLLAKLTDIRRSKQRPWVQSVNQAIGGSAAIDFFSLGRGIISNDLLHPFGGGYQQMAQLALNRLTVISETNRPLDLDGDGIYDFAESMFGTHVNNPDSDGDGLPDGIEVFTYGSNPLSLDSDGDGFLDFFEVTTMGSNPADPAPGAPVIERLEVIAP